MSNASEPTEIRRIASDLVNEDQLNHFQIQVARAIRYYRKRTTQPSVRRKWTGKGRQPRTKRRKLPQAEKMEQQVEKLIARPDIRKYLCPALKSVSNDAFEIAKIITPILLGLIIAGKIVIDIEPLIFAAISIFIARGGIASMCEGYGPKEIKVQKSRKTTGKRRLTVR